MEWISAEFLCGRPCRDGQLWSRDKHFSPRPPYSIFRTARHIAHVASDSIKTARGFRYLGTEALWPSPQSHSNPEIIVGFCYILKTTSRGVSLPVCLLEEGAL